MNDEWLLLQKQHEHYEFAAMAIKLAAVAIVTLHPPAVLLLLAVLWGQEAIIKTFQSRLGERLLRLEAMLREGQGQAMQLHTDWLASRPRGVALLGEYLRSACRPTVAFPYPVLMVISLLV
jgi:hypothetical protein